VKILASLAIGTVAILMVLFAWLCLIFIMNDSLVLEFMSAMCKATLVTKLASLSEFPVLAKFSLVFTLIVFNKESSLLNCGKLLASGADIYFKAAFRGITDR